MSDGSGLQMGSVPPPLNTRMRKRLEAPVATAAGLLLLLALVLFVRLSLHWPLVGDAPLLHYGVFLMRHGWAPYRQFVDPNLPGAYAVQFLIIRLFGYGALPWRLYDLLLLLGLGGAALALLWSGRRPWRTTLAALWVTTLFALEHGRDGLIDLGQRDLLMTLLLGLACAALVASARQGSCAVRQPGSARAATLAGCCGLCIGAAATVKPLALLLLPALLLLYPAGRRSRTGAWIAAAAAAAVPLLAMLLYLLQQHALGAFWHIESRLVPLHSSLFRKPVAQLVFGCIASTMLPLILLSLPVLLRSRPWRSFSGRVLLTGFCFGVVSFVVQGRGYPYHRYPSLFFLLLLCARGFLLLPRHHHRRLYAASATAAVVFSLAVTAPHALTAMRRFTPSVQPFRQALGSALLQRGGALLSGRVQCFDMAAGCVATLLELRLLPATGYLYDCYALAPVAPAFRDEQRRYRAAWLAALEHAPPALLIVTSDECGPRDLRYSKLDRWPALTALLQQHYAVVDQWQPHLQENWNGHPMLPYGFRLYALR